MTVALVLAALLAALCVVFVAQPFLRDPAPPSDVLEEPGELERRAVELAEERDRALAALKELEFDHRTGKIADDDYRALIGPLRARAAEALRGLEPKAAFRSAPNGDDRRPGGRAGLAGVESARPLHEEMTMVEIPEPPRPPDTAPVPEPAPIPEPSPTPVPEPYPPPDEATPPEPARVPEPGPL